MTNLTKPVTRRTLTDSPERHPRKIVVTLYPGGSIGLREAGRRTTFEIPLTTLYKYGARLEADRKRTERLAKKKAHK